MVIGGCAHQETLVVVWCMRFIRISYTEICLKIHLILWKSPEKCNDMSKVRRQKCIDAAKVRREKYRDAAKVRSEKCNNMLKVRRQKCSLCSKNIDITAFKLYNNYVLKLGGECSCTD